MKDIYEKRLLQAQKVGILWAFKARDTEVILWRCRRVADLVMRINEKIKGLC